MGGLEQLFDGKEEANLPSMLPDFDREPAGIFKSNLNKLSSIFNEGRGNPIRRSAKTATIFDQDRISRLVNHLIGKAPVHYKCKALEDLPSEIIVNPMLKEDIEAVAELYRKVSVNSQNIKEKTDPKNQRSWKRTGGMFHAVTSNELEEMLKDDSTSLLVAKKEDGAVIGFFSASSVASFDDIEFNKEIPGAEEIYKKADAEKSAITGLDLLVDPEYRLTALHSILEYNHLKRFAEDGFRQLRFEVYTIKGVSNQGGKMVPLELPNLPSQQFHENIGAICVGHINKKIEVPPYNVSIESSIYTQDIPSSLGLLQQRMLRYIF